MNDSRGSIWRKWDLHVHTPASLVHNYEGADPWPQFLDDLEHLPPEFKVIGINDYIFLDGYRRILAEKQNGRLANIELFLPVIELRLDKFGGSQGHLSRVNYHIIFSDELTPDLIEQHFLNALPNSYTLTPQFEPLRTSGKWKALPTKVSLEDLGNQIIASVPAQEQKHFGSPLIEGFNNLCFNLPAIETALGSHYFKGKFVTAVGKTEWADIKWNDQSIADKKHIINAATFVFSASASAAHWQNAHKTLLAGGVNARLLDCSDAHASPGATDKDRLGNCLTWVKADTTFQELLQLEIEFDERRAKDFQRFALLRFVFCSPILPFVFNLPETWQCDFTVCCKKCGENIPAPVGTMPDSWIVARCPLCGEKRSYLPSEIFRARLSHKLVGKPARSVVQ